MASSTPQEQFKVYPKRHLIVFLFALSQLMTSVLMNTLTPIASYLTQIYHHSPFVVNLGSLLFALMHPIFTFPAAFVIDTYGTRVGIAVGCILCFVGASLRLLVNVNFVFVILGQVIAGMGRPFILNCQAKISANWFTAKVRGGVTQLLTLILNISLIIGFFIPGIVFGDYNPEKYNRDNLEQGQELTFKLMFVELIMAVICYLPNILFQQSKPPTPPSDSGNVQRDPFKTMIPKLLKNKNYLLLLVAFGCYFGIFNATSIILSYLLEPWFGGDRLPYAVACVGGSPIITGIIGVIVLGSIQRKSGKFRKYIIICMIGSCSAMVFFYPLLETGSLILASFVSAYNSFFLIPLVPIMIQLSCQLAFPVGQGSAAGLLFAAGNFFGFGLGFILSWIVQGQSKGQTAAGLGFCFAVFLIGLGLIWIMKEEKNRLNYEASSQKNRSERKTVESIQPQRMMETFNSDKQNLKSKLITNPREQQNLML